MPSISSLPMELLEILIEYVLPLDIVRMRALRISSIPDLLWPTVLEKHALGKCWPGPLPHLTSSRHTLSIKFPRHHETMFRIRRNFSSCENNIRTPQHYRRFAVNYLSFRDKWLRSDERATLERKSKERAELRETRQRSMDNDRLRRQTERSSVNLLRDCKNTVRRHALPPSQRG